MQLPAIKAADFLLLAEPSLNNKLCVLQREFKQSLNNCQSSNAFIWIVSI